MRLGRCFFIARCWFIVVLLSVCFAVRRRRAAPFLQVARAKAEKRPPAGDLPITGQT